MDATGEPVARRRIAVVALGHADDPRIWSGSVPNLVSALQRQGLEVVCVDAGVRGWWRLPWLLRYHSRRWWHSPLRSKLDPRLQRTLLREGYRSDFHWDLHLRQRRSRIAMDQVRAAGIEVVLHCTPNAIPLEPPEGIVQLAYLDATWTSQTRHRVPQGPGRYPSAIVAEGDEHERRSHSHLAHVFTMGEWARDQVLALGIPEVRTSNVGTGIPGHEHGRSHEVEPEPGRMLVAVKDLLGERGVPTAVEALQIARQSDPRLHMVIVGNSAAVRRYGHLPGVEAHGYVPRATLDDELDRASLLVQPAEYMVWGMVFLEAMEAKTPVLALDRCATPEITEDGALGFLVERQDPRMVAEAMVDAFSDDRRLRKMGEEARRSVVRRFSWDGVAAKMASVIDEVSEPAP